MITVAARTGLRLSAPLALRWADVDLTAVASSYSERWREGLSGLRRAGGIERCRSVRKRSQRSRRTKGATKWPLWTSAKNAQLRRIGWHVFRHTFASQLVVRDTPLKAAQELMGHSTIEMTMRYAHLRGERR